jgi:hypothetical protein
VRINPVLYIGIILGYLCAGNGNKDSCKISFVLQRKSSVIQLLCLENIVLQNSFLGLLFKGIVKLEKRGSSVIQVKPSLPHIQLPMFLGQFRKGSGS